MSDHHQRDIRPGVRRMVRLEGHRPESTARDADAELDAVIDAQMSSLVGRGMDPDEARRVVFGAVDAATYAAVRASAHERERALRWRDTLRDAAVDARYAARTLRRNPGFATAAVATLALAIGANTAIFSAVNAVLLRPLPFADPKRLVAFYETNPDFGWTRAESAPANAIDWRDRVSAFHDVGAWFDFPTTRTLTGFGEPRLLVTRTVTENLFQVLGVQAALGRLIEPSDVALNAPAELVVLSHHTWRTVFTGDSAIIGKTVEMGGRPARLIGVLPRSFAIPGFDADIYTPFGETPTSLRSAARFRRAHYLRPVGRLKSGVTLAGANAELQSVVSQLQREYPETNTHMGAGILPLHDFLVGDRRRPLLVMFAAVGILLLIACANVANLLLVRAAGRQREVALRLALGAGRGRIARQGLAESAVLALAGGAAGLALGWAATRVLATLAPPGLLPVSNIAISRTVLGYASLAAVTSALAFGIAPALWMTRRAPADALKEEGRASSGGRRTRRWGEALVVCEVALALALALGAGLLARSYALLRTVDPGFQPHGVLAVTLNLPRVRYAGTPQMVGFYEALERRVSALPGVQSAALVSQIPLTTPPWSSQFAVQGREPPPSTAQVLHREISPAYQDVMRVPLRAGRHLAPSDGADAPFVVLVNEAFVREHFPNENPIGLRIAFDRMPDSTSVWRTIVGVVGDERIGAMALEPRAEIIAPFPQEPRQGMTLMVRTSGDPVRLGPAVRQTITDLDKALAITSMQTMDDVRAAALARDRFLTVLMLAFAGVGMALAVVGVYGVVAQMARRRTREMGIRLALGANADQVQWLVVRHGLGFVIVGVGLGVSAALMLSRTLRTLLYQVAPADPATFIIVPAMVVASAVVASWAPAVRAGRTPPAEVLRAD
jgi:putative ABC transport system permease protein